MKLYKALKLKKTLTGEISKLKQQISEKNSYQVGSLNEEKFKVSELYNKLLSKINELTNLKFMINEANREIQASIYMLSEYKALISFWNGVSVLEGTKNIGYGSSVSTEFKVQVDEIKRDEYIDTYQKKIDSLQEEIDTYNYTTDIPWKEE
jgi:hypothetical protein